jgi:hypothetical protein
MCVFSVKIKKYEFLERLCVYKIKTQQNLPVDSGATTNTTSNIHDRDMHFTLAISLLHKGNGNHYLILTD